MNANARKWGPAIITLALAFVVFVLTNLAMAVPPVVFAYRTAVMVVRLFV